MTLKISYFKLIRSNMKQKIWYGALSLLGFFLTLPLPVIIWGDLEESRGIVENTAEYQEYVMRLLQGKIGALGLLVVCMALLGAWTGLSYLHSKKKMDLYGSLPVKREKMILCGSMDTFLLFFGGYLFNVLLTILIMAVKNIMNGYIFQAALTGMGIHLLFFLFFYFTAAIAMLLTGKIFVGILGTGVFLSAGPAIFIILNTLPEIFFKHYISTQRFSQILSYLSPIFTYLEVVANNREKVHEVLRYGSVAGPLIFAVICTVLLAGLTLWLAHIRPAESAEKAMAFSKTEGPVKGIILYIISILAGIFFYGMFSNNETWLWFFMIFSFVVFSIIIEIIYHQDRRRIINHKLCTGISCGLAVLTVACFCFDITGYDQWIPKKDQVENAIVFCGEWRGYYSYGEEKRKEYVSTHMEQYHNEDAFSIAREGIRHENDQEAFWDVEVWYQMKNGKIKKRSYGFTEKMYNEIRDGILDKKSGRILAYPILLRLEEPVFVSAYEYGDDFEDMVDASEFTMAQRKEILDLYLNELETLESTQIWDDSGIVLGNKKNGIEEYYPLSDQFTKTVEKIRMYKEESMEK